MRTILIRTIGLFMLIYAADAHAQESTITISGKITSFEESLPLEGVTVQAKGGKTITGTLPDGSFSLAIVTTEKTLVISLAGYEKQEIPVTNKREYNIVLRRSNNVSGHLPVWLLTPQVN